MIVAGLLACTGCPADGLGQYHPDPNDASPPTTQFTVYLHRGDATDRDGIEKLKQDEHRRLHPDTVLELQALASENRSAIDWVRITGHVTKVCDLGDGSTQRKAARVLVQQPDPSDPPSNWVDAGWTVDIGYVPCPNNSTMLGAYGDLHVQAQNTVGLTSDSYHFRWEWADP